MVRRQHPWIKRSFVDQIVKAAEKADGSVHVFLLHAGGGEGKTYAGRDAGHRLGSADGYEPHVGERLAWSGLLDLYDPDTNSNQGLERRLSQVFDPEGFDFEEYDLERKHYDLFFKGGIQGADLEAQRHRVEEAFAAGLRRAAAKRRLVIALDTVERIEAVSDPTRQRMALAEDTASVAGWLAYQITQVPNCVWVLMGRRCAHFAAALDKAAAALGAGAPGPIAVHDIPLDQMDEHEVERFYAHRIRQYPELAAILDPATRALLVQRAAGNPLLLDLALQGLLETQDPAALRRALGQHEGIVAAGRALVEAYVQALDPDRELLLRYLAMARNGLSAELLAFLEPRRAAALTGKLRQMGNLPFIKVRQIATAGPGGTGSVDCPTYFLHDEMYAICDEVLYSARDARYFSRRLVEWYDQQFAALRAAPDAGPGEAQQRRRFEQDLAVQSLFYRLRADPATGYAWYLRQEDIAIRSAQTGLDMRLRDAFALFLESADPTSSPPEAAPRMTSRIDRSIVRDVTPRLFDDFLLDSAALWILRYTIRGRHDDARAVGVAMRPEVEALYEKDRERYRLPYAAFLLWYAQVLMYQGEIDPAMAIYRPTIAMLEPHYSAEILARMEEDPACALELWRAALVLGRLHNNVGYTCWMYQGRFRQAVAEFRKAIALFRGRLPEELANSQDNMGRVFARLGDEFAALQLIKEGWLTRRDLGHAYREALSLISWAVTLARLGHPEPGLKKAHAAVTQVRQTEVARGRGLVLYARGIVYRILAESWREEGIPVEEALEKTNLAEIDLRDALEIFTGPVKESIREVRALNELACVHRARYLILAVAGRPEVERERAYYDALRVFRETIRRARECHYQIEELDSMQDLAVLYARVGQPADAEKYLAEVVRKIPREYQIRKGAGLPDVPQDDQVDLYYKLMGQVELLRGAIAFLGGRRSLWEEVAGPPDDKSLLRAAEYYFLAVAYYNRYSAEYAGQQTNVRIHDRFRVCTPEQIRLLRTRFAEWTAEYGLEAGLVRSLTEVVFGLLD